MSLVFVFLDGIGLAPAGPDNPLAEAPTPALRALLGRPLVAGPSLEGAGLLFRPIDATLGVDGLPQSGTGHTALLAGVNAPRLHGRHQPHFPPVALRPLLAEQSLFRRVLDGGGTAAFANVFTPGYWEALANRRIRRAASVIAAEGAGLRFRDLDDLREGRALSPDITGETMRDRGTELVPISPETAGHNLAQITADHDFTFFECFLPDLAGHARLSIGLGTVMALIDGMIGGLLQAKRPSDTLVITSDHGNVESIIAPAHTRNPVPLLAVGPAAGSFAAVADISQVADAVLLALG